MLKIVSDSKNQIGILNITVFVFITIIASFSLSQVYALPIIYDDDYMVEKFVTGLEYPTTMIFVGEDILVLEKNTGKVIRIQDNGIIYNEPVLDVPVIFQGKGGLLGIAFASNHFYLFFTESLSGFDTFAHENVGRNVVYQYDWNGEKLINPILIKEFPTTCIYINASCHHSGGITTGINNEIYFQKKWQSSWEGWKNHLDQADKPHPPTHISNVTRMFDEVDPHPSYTKKWM